MLLHFVWLQNMESVLKLTTELLLDLIIKMLQGGARDLI